MPYKAMKPCMLQGTQYYIGDTLPPEAVLPGAEAGLIRRGYIASIPDMRVETVEIEKPVEVEKIVEKEVPIPFTLAFSQSEGGPVKVEIHEAEMQMAVNMLCMNADDTVKALQEVDSVAVLLVVEHMDARKTVISAAQKRLEELAAALEEGGS